jgi:hypothetical protein
MIRSLVAAIAITITLLACDKSVGTTTQSNIEANLLIAEAFIDAFYSFDLIKLQATLSSAEGSASSIAYYQGWAEGGNYKIIERKTCQSEASNLVHCSITVQDDPMLALGIDFNVTDTFKISFTDGEITSVETSSDDLQIYHDAREWVMKELPELIEQPCQGFFDDGQTPGDCVRAMTEGYRIFTARH